MSVRAWPASSRCQRSSSVAWSDCRSPPRSAASAGTSSWWVRDTSARTLASDRRREDLDREGPVGLERRDELSCGEQPWRRPPCCCSASRGAAFMYAWRGRRTRPWRLVSTGSASAPARRLRRRPPPLTSNHRPRRRRCRLGAWAAEARLPHPARGVGAQAPTGLNPLPTHLRQCCRAPRRRWSPHRSRRPPRRRSRQQPPLPPRDLRPTQVRRQLPPRRRESVRRQPRLRPPLRPRHQHPPRHGSQPQPQLQPQLRLRPPRRRFSP